MNRKLYRRTRYVDILIKINGKSVNLYFAKQVYRCEVCLSKLRVKDVGLVCGSDESHRGFRHQTEAAEEAKKRAVQLEQIETVYEIRDGQIVVKES